MKWIKRSSLLTESTVYFSDDFRKILKQMRSVIADELLKIELTDIKSDMTFIDIKDLEKGKISFSQLDNVERKLDQNLKNLSKSQLKTIFPKIKNTSRMETKLGRLINRFFPKKFKDKEIEKFVNQFKSLNIEDKLILVSGDDILKYYNCANYHESSIDTPLGNSCMKMEWKQEYLKWYAINPNSVNMLVMIDDNDKVKARALIWKVNSDSDNYNEFQHIMDRIYYIDDEHEEKFKNYAIKKGWGYKDTQSVEIYDIFFNGKNTHGKYYITMENDTEHYPYLDTFQFYDMDSTISNDTEFGMVKLNSTTGEFEPTGEFEQTGKWSEYYGTMIPDMEAIWSEYLNSYILESDSVWSNFHDSYILREEAELVYLDSFESKKDWYHENVRGEEFFHIEKYDEYFISELIVEDVYGNYQLVIDCEKVSETSMITNKEKIKFSSHVPEWISKDLAIEFNKIEEDIFNIDKMEFNNYILKDDLIHDMFIDKHLNVYKWKSLTTNVFIKQRLISYIKKREKNNLEEMLELKWGGSASEISKSLISALNNSFKKNIFKEKALKIKNDLYNKDDVPDIKQLKKDIKLLVIKILPKYYKADILTNKHLTELFNKYRNYSWVQIAYITTVFRHMIRDNMLYHYNTIKDAELKEVLAKLSDKK